MTKSNKVPPAPPLPPGGIPKLSDANVYEARTLYNDGWTKADIASKLQCSVPTVSDAIHGRNAYKDV